MFNSSMFDNSRPDGFAVLEVVKTSPEGPRQFVPLRRTELTGEITGPLADLHLVQYFGYRAEQCDKTPEALYRFPLPGNAAVTGVTVRFGDVEICAELKEREQAEADYEEAKRLGQQAALATRESPDVFTLRVAGLQPDQEIRVETTYVQLARMEGSDWTLRIPLTTAPRYVRADEANSRHAEGQPLALLRDPGHRFSLDLRLPDAEGITSSTHALSTISEEGAARVRLSDGEVMPDRDCVLNWHAVQESQHPALHLHLYDDRAENAIYFLALIAPPEERAATSTVARESILLVDHSGSMHGAKWEAADWAVKQFLGGLKPEDTFALGLFHSSVRWFGDMPRRADTGTVAAAIEFLEKHRDSGGTELGVALEQAVGQKRSGGEMSRHILILTDAEVSDSGRVLRLAESESARSDRRRISVLCIDAAPNSFLARELAERGGGTATFLTSQPDQDDISTALDRILEDWAAPVHTGLRLEVNRTGAQAVGRATLAGSRDGGSAIDIGDLPAGRAVWAAGRVPRGESDDLAFRLLTADGHEVAARRCDLTAKPAGAAVKALFGASRVLALEFLTTGYYDEDQLRAQLERLGYDPEAFAHQTGSTPMYAENVQRNAREGLKPLLVREALRYGVASSETAFIAVRKEAGKQVQETTIVANALPTGWSDRFVTHGITAGAQGFGDVLLCAVMPSRSMGLTSGMMSQASTPRSPSRRGRSSYSTRDAVQNAAATPPATPPQQHRGLQELKDDIAAAGSSVLGAVSGLFKKSLAVGSPVSVSRDEEDSVDDPAILLRNGNPLFSGTPTVTDREAVLFDTARAEDGQRLAGARTFTRLIVRFLNGTPDTSVLDAGLTLLIYVDDLASPRARVGVADMVRQGGSRPLNIQRSGEQAIRIVLDDPNGAWRGTAPAIELTLK